MEVKIEDIVTSRMCHGCGACSYACTQGAIELINFTDIGIRPVVDRSRCVECSDCVSVCSGIELKHREDSFAPGIQEDLRKEWGPVLELWEGYATDAEMRFRGGSGGVATALATFALQELDMDGVLHVGMNAELPILNDVVMSRSRLELLNRTGSRYAPAAVASALGQIETSDRSCVLIGKPCDIASARMAAQLRPQLSAKLGLTIAIFCGGTPSTRGTLKLLEILGVQPSEISDLRYRGHGWPGMTGVNLRRSSDGTRVEMTYAKAWDTILTRYKPFRCQICPDGTGEFADIACGDPWYREVQEDDLGSTLIVVRTELGRKVLQAAISAGYISAFPCPNSVLPASQRGLLHRRRAVFPKLAALRLFGMLSPTLVGFSLFYGWMQHSFRQRYWMLYRAARWIIGLRRKGPIDLTAENIFDSDCDQVHPHSK